MKKHLTTLILLFWAMASPLFAQIDPDFFTYKNKADACLKKRDYPCAEKWYRAALVIKKNDTYCNQQLAETWRLANQPKPPTPASATTTDPFAGQMVLVQGGSFEMGSNEGTFDSEKPVHRRNVSSFYMGKTEVTQAQWRAVMGNNPSHFKNCSSCPVEQVSWNDVEEFLKKLNARTNQAYRLPTEAEWEYAAGGGSTNRTRFANGRDILDPEQANFDASASYKQPYSVAGQYRRKTTPVGSFAPNALGLYDMSGNVWEWCADWDKGYPGSSSVSDYTNQYRFVRGCSWGDPPQNCRVANRDSYDPTVDGACIGFRLALSQ